MTIPADLLRAVAHALLDVTVVSGVLALVALAVARIPGVDAGARSRWWSAVAIVPLFVFAVALAQPLALRGAVSRAVPAPIAGAVLIDPLDALQSGARAANAPAFGAAHGTAPVRSDSPEAPFPWLPLAVALWFAIAIVRVGLVFVSIARAHRIVARSAPALSASARCADIARVAASARVELRVCDGFATPVAVGLTRRAVVVPARLADTLSAAELRAVVCHEIAHLERRDDWAYLLERIACAVLWFDPILHAAQRASSTWREVACD
ncbi:MAG TPA: M56 family metallopeptidase, partial [Xanthomonadales bacterium]|nr:M56 family metallopeptidase [Xanthomonadales bacterium]